jgi:putative acetyltransferase
VRLRPASLDDFGFVQRLWTKPAHADFLEKPEDGQIAHLTNAGNLLIWQGEAAPIGFAALVEWNPKVWGLHALAVDTPGQGQGGLLLRAVLAEVFGARGAHRLGLDVTVDNHAARRLYTAHGFTQEGIFRECWQRPRGDYVDCVFMSILNREYRP